MTLVRLEPAAPRSRVKHSTTEPLRSQSTLCGISSVFTVCQSTCLLVSSIKMVNSSIFEINILLQFDWFVCVTNVYIYRSISLQIDIVLEKDDFKVEVMRSSGPGGQSVNTANSAVRLTHIPTGKFKITVFDC